MTRHYHIPLFYTPYYIPYSPISFIYIVHVSCYICHTSYYLNSCKSLTISKGREVKNGRNEYKFVSLNPLSAKLKKWPNTLKQFVGNLPTNCLSVFGHFVGMALKGLIKATSIILETGNFLRKTENKFTFQKGNISAYYSIYSPKY